MSLSSALSIAMSGLSANQTALSITSSNVANAQTPGYVARSPDQVEVNSGDSGASVLISGVNRQLDQYLQSQLRTETSGGAYADQISSVLQQLQSVYGTPGSAGTLETAFSNFTTALQALSSNSGTSSAQTSALTAAQALAQQLNATTQGIQTLRTNAEQDIGTSVTQANADMSQIAQINAQLQGMASTDPSAATLMDQRDSAINDLSTLMGVRVTTDNTNQTQVYTTSGVQLVSGPQAATLSFTNEQSQLNANSLWNSNPAKSGAGTITLTSSDGSRIDMIANNAISSGKIGADLTLRDTTLVQAQAQVDQLAATLSGSLSDTTTAGTAVTSGTQSGFNVDLSNVLPGNSINLTYTNTATNTQQQVQIVSVADPTALPLPNTGSNPKVIGINFTGGAASVAAQLNAALSNSGLQFSNPSGSTLQVLNTSYAATTVNAASTTTTASSLANGSPQLPLFTDGSSLYTGAITGQGSQQTGFAGRIMVNAALLANPSNLTVYNTSPATSPGDTTRTDYLYSQLTSGSFTYSPQTGLGSTTTPLTGTISSYMQQFLSLQGNSATSAQQLAQGQDTVVSTLQQKVSSTSGVSIDTEMSNLIALQNSYAANAHVMSVVQSMMNTLLQAQT